MIRWARVSTRFEGLHCWPQATEEVRFLLHLHRHEFHVTLWIEQYHDQRDVEYITLKRWLKDLLDAGFPESFSCEAMAREIIFSARQAYGPERKYQCEVLEDGENGALLELRGDS